MNKPTCSKLHVEKAHYPGHGCARPVRFVDRLGRHWCAIHGKMNMALYETTMVDLKAPVVSRTEHPAQPEGYVLCACNRGWVRADVDVYGEKNGHGYEDCPRADTLPWLQPL